MEQRCASIAVGAADPKPLPAIVAGGDVERRNGHLGGHQRTDRLGRFALIRPWGRTATRQRGANRAVFLRSSPALQKPGVCHRALLLLRPADRGALNTSASQLLARRDERKTRDISEDGLRNAAKCAGLLKWPTAVDCTGLRPICHRPAKTAQPGLSEGRYLLNGSFE